MKKVLVTGASGFIGSRSLALLANKGYQVHALSTKSIKKEQQGILWHQVDLFDSVGVAALMDQLKPTHLLHFAWYTVHGKFWTSPLNLNWVQASLHLLQAFVQQGGKRFVGAGTCAEYDWNQEIYSEKSTPCNPATLYGTCKAALHQMMSSYCKQESISFAWGRIFHLYGSHEHPDRFVPAVIQKLLKKEHVPCSHGEQVRDFLHVEDVASAFVSLINSDSEGAVNIGSGRGIKLKEVSQLIAERIGEKQLIQLGALKAPALDPPILVAVTERLFQEIGWQPHYDLERGLEQTIDWWREQS